MSNIPWVAIAVPGERVDTPTVKGSTDYLRVRNGQQVAEMVRVLYQEFGLDPTAVLVIQGQKDAQSYWGHVLREERAVDLLMRMRGLFTLKDS